MESYKSFAQIYDELIKKDIDYEAWSKFIFDILKENNTNLMDYLDLACGTGNLTLALGKKFQNIWGVDLAEDMLTNAYSKLINEGINARLVCQNISKLNLNKSFDLITCALDSVNYLLQDVELEDFFIGVYRHLKPEGIFIFDTNSFYKLTNIMGNNVFTFNSEDIVYLWENTLMEDILHMYLTFFVRKGALYERFEEEHRERAYKESTIIDLLKRTGFKLNGVFDSYQKLDPSEKTERIVYVLRK